MRKTLRIFINTLRRLTFAKFWAVAKLAAGHPVFAVLSFVATVRAFTLAVRYFPDSHSTTGLGNAFRHALWSGLILMYCCKVSSPQKAKGWCIKMTDLHEEIFPNSPLERFMDLHNNQIGITMFFEMLPGIHRQFFETGFLVEALLVKAKTAEIFSRPEEQAHKELIYLQK